MLAGKLSPLSFSSTDTTKYANRKIKCNYDAASIATDCEVATDFAKYKKRELEQTDYDNWFDPQTMTQLCSSRAPVAACPLNPSGPSPVDSQGKICSQMVTCNLCKQWANSTWTGAKDESDNIIMDWCTKKHTDDPACKCENKMNDKLYRDLQSAMPAAAGCWYKSCIDKNFQYDMVNSKDRTWDNCPTTLCMDVVQAFDDASITINDLTQEIHCTGDFPTPDAGCVPTCVHGKCVKTSGASACVCSMGWEGTDCSTPTSGGGGTSPPAVKLALGVVDVCSLALLFYSLYRGNKYMAIGAFTVSATSTTLLLTLK
jgi:hypothetical protein